MIEKIMQGLDRYSTKAELPFKRVGAKPLSKECNHGIQEHPENVFVVKSWREKKDLLMLLLK